VKTLTHLALYSAGCRLGYYPCSQEALLIAVPAGTIDTAEATLRHAVVATFCGGTRDATTADVVAALVARTGMSANEFTVRPFFPEHFIVLCSSQAARDRALGASPLPLWGSSLLLCPWTRVAHADLSALYYKVSLELEGVPPHVWRADTAAKLLAPFCWIQSIDQQTSAKEDLSAYKLTAWTHDPSSIPLAIKLAVAEPDEQQRQARGFRFRGTQTIWRKPTSRHEPPSAIPAERTGHNDPRRFCCFVWHY
jgi:hypothetical protein